MGLRFAGGELERVGVLSKIDMNLVKKSKNEDIMASFCVSCKHLTTNSSELNPFLRPILEERYRQVANT